MKCIHSSFKTQIIEASKQLSIKQLLKHKLNKVSRSKKKTRSTFGIQYFASSRDTFLTQDEKNLSKEAFNKQESTATKNNTVSRAKNQTRSNLYIQYLTSSKHPFLFQYENNWSKQAFNKQVITAKQIAQIVTSKKLKKFYLVYSIFWKCKASIPH